jgi:threonyl-tRNA synthetase
VLRDAIGRDWQCGTMQVDMNLPSASTSSTWPRTTRRKRPGDAASRLFGSLERFTGILIEHYAGALPLWLAPVHAVVLNISEGQAIMPPRWRKCCKKARLSGRAGFAQRED